MDEPRTSLWSRLVIFYSIHKRDQLNPEVMAQIVSKYGSKEKELSARLLKKYGQPLPPSVPPADLRRVLTEFGMEDQDLVAGAAGRARGGEAGPAGTGSGLSTAPAAATAAAEIGERAQGPQRSHLAQAGGAGEGKEEKKKGGRAGEDRGGREGRGEGERREGERRDEQRGRESRAVERAPRGSELDFRSKYFDPLQALRHKKLRPPFPKQPALDNVAKFGRMLPRPPPSSSSSSSSAAGAVPAAAGMSAAAAAAVAIAASFLREAPENPAGAAGPSSATGIPARDGGEVVSPGSIRPRVEARPARAGDVPSAAAAVPPGIAHLGRVDGGGSSKVSVTAGSRQVGCSGGVPPAAVEAAGRSDGRVDVGGPVGGHYGPPVGSAADIEKADRDMALKRRRAAELFLTAGGGGGSAATLPAEEKVNPVQRIMDKYAGTGPYSLLYRLHEEKRRASVMIRRVNSVRGTCTGLIRAFDRHMNLLLVDVQEVYTAFVPARDGGERGGGGGNAEDPHMLSKPPWSSKKKTKPPRRTAPSGAQTGRTQAMDVERAQAGEGRHSADIEDVSGPAAADARASPGVRVNSDGGAGSGKDVVRGPGDGLRGQEARAGAAARRGAGGPVASSSAVRDAGGTSTNEIGGSSGGDGVGNADNDNIGQDTEGARLKRPGRDPGAISVPDSVPPAEGDKVRGQGGGFGDEKRGQEEEHGRGTTRKVLLAQEWGVDSDADREGGAQEPPATPEGTKQQPLAEGKAGVDDGERGDLRGDGQSKPETRRNKSSRRHRGRGPWTGELMPVRRERFLKQVLIRGDNVVMIWEPPKL